MWKDKELKIFEANMLDGDPIDDCGKCMFSAGSVFEYLITRMEEREEEIRKEYTIMGKSTD